MRRFGGLRLAGLAVAGMFLIAGGQVALAQGMPMNPATAAVSHCLCLQQEMQALSSRMNAKLSELDSVRHQLADQDAQLQTARGQVDVNNPESVGRFKQLLERRDATFRHSTGPLVSEARHATEHYNDVVGQYNAQCANRPMDPELMNALRPTLSCPPIQ